MKQPSDDWKSLDIAIEKLPTETNDSYQAFLKFCWLQGKERSPENVAEELGYSVMTCRAWSFDHKWLDRADMVDAIKWKHEFTQRERLLEKDNQKFAEQNRHIKDQAMANARKMLNVANNLLAKAEIVDETVETGMVETKDGRMVPTFTEIRMKSKISDIPRLVDTAVKTARLVQDLPTEIIEAQVPVGADISNLSIEEILALREKNQRYLREKGAERKIETVSEAQN